MKETEDEDEYFHPISILYGASLVDAVVSKNENIYFLVLSGLYGMVALRRAVLFVRRRSGDGQ